MARATDVAEKIAALLLAKGQSLAVAEASAGGLICARLTQVPGSSRWFAGGAVVYGNRAKERLAAVPAETIHRFGAASAETAAAMAEGVCPLLAADWGLAETGVAGPQTGRRSAKPAGLTYLAVCGPLPPRGQGEPDGQRRSGGVLVQEVRTGLDGRVANQRAFADAALAMLLQVLEGAT